MGEHSATLGGAALVVDIAIEQRSRFSPPAKLGIDHGKNHRESMPSGSRDLQPDQF
jgi:hypothetical protein